MLRFNHIRDSLSDKLKKLSLPTLTYRQARRDMIEVYKILNIHDIEVCPNLSLNNQLTWGHCFKLNKNRAQKDIRQYYFTLRVTDMWNSVPVSELTAETLQSFKNHLDKAWCKLEFKFDYRAALPAQSRTTRNY